MAMPPSGAEHQPPSAGRSATLSHRGAVWAHATIDESGNNVSLGCTLPKDPWSFPSRVTLQLEPGRKIECTVYANGSNVPSHANRLVLRHDLGDGQQKLALVDAAGAPWAEVELSDEVRLFDLSGRERVRITSEWGLTGRRLHLRCLDESGHELSGQQALKV
jgi:hypothetical protein